MEGDCDGMVAIVQGLMDAGLRVTMLDGRRGKWGVRDRSTGDVYAMPACSRDYESHRPVIIRKRPSTSTSTETKAITYKKNAGVQICDGRYASSYQMAHCKLVPSSPPVHLPEFPPQRAQPSSGLGNFEVGGSGSGKRGYTPLMPVVPEMSHRNSFASPEREHIKLRPSLYMRGPLTKLGRSSLQEVSGDTRDGLLRHKQTNSDGCHSQTSQLGVFANSLRRYPLSPDRSLSSDLVQRLITYTQAKNLSKCSSHSKSMRSVSRDRTPSPTGSYQRPDRPTKHIQTYTRTQELPTKDISNSLSEYVAKNNNTANEYSNVRYKDNQLNQSVEYTRSTRPPKRSRMGHPEVMYLSNVTKVIRETLKQIYSEHKPLAVMQMCPSMRSRYNLHKSKYHKQSTGQQSGNDTSNIDIQVSPTTSRCVPLPRLSPNHSARTKLCCFCHKPPPCSCIAPIPDKPICPCPKRPDYGKLLEDQIRSWLCEIPVFINDSGEDKLTRHAMAMKLADTLKIFDEEEFEAKAKNEILKCIDSLPMWYPGAKRDQEVFKDSIANSLLDRIKDLPRDRLGEKKQRKEMKSPDEAHKHVIDILDDEQTVSLNDGNVEPTQAAELRKMSADFTQRINDESDNVVSDWIKEVSSPLGYDLNEDKTAVHSLIQGLHAFEKQDVSDPNVQNEMNSMIRGWLDTAKAGRGELEADTKNNLTEKLMYKLIDISDTDKKIKKEKADELFTESVEDKPTGRISIQENGCLGKVAEKAGRKLSGQDDLLSAKIAEKSGRRLSGQDDLSTGKSAEKAGRRLSGQSDGKAAKMAEDSNEKPESRESRRESMEDNELVNEMWSLFEHVTNSEKQDAENKRLIQDLADKIKNLIKDETKLFEEVQGDVLGLMTMFFNKVNVGSKPKDDRVNRFIKNLKSFPKPRKRWVSQDELQNSIQDAMVELPINDALRQLAPNDRKEVKSKIANISANYVGTLKTPDASYTKLKIANVLVQDGMVHSIKAQNLAENIIDKVRAMSSSNTKKTSFSQAYDNKISTADGVGNIRSPPGDISSFPEKPSKTSLKRSFKREMNGSAQKQKLKINDNVQLDSHLTGILSDEILRGSMITRDIISLLQGTDGPLSDADSKKSILSQIALRNVTETHKVYNASTPRQSMDRSLPDAFMSPIPGQTWNPRRYPDSNEKKYINELAIIIDEWMDELSLDFSATENKGFKETMVNDLAADIVDRQKYLQLNPSAKTSEIEELEHLKYQVFKWLHKLMDTGEIANIMPRTKILMDRLKAQRIPSLTKAKREESLLRQGEIPHFSDVLEDEITSWLHEVPSHMVKIKDRNEPHMVKELSQKIQQKKNDKDFDVDREIEQWTSRVITGNRRSISRWSDMLKERLKNKGFAGDTSWVLAQDTSQFIEENLAGAMQDWLRNSPLYQNKTPEERQQQRQILHELAREMRIVIDNASPGEDIDDLLLNEIIKYLRKFPQTPEERNAFLARTAAELLEYLKGLQMFQDISIRHFSMSSDMQLVHIIEDWVESLPINPRKNSTENRQFDTMKEEFVSKIKHLRIKQVFTSDEESIRVEIKKYLLLLPIEPAKRQDEEYLDEKIDELLNNIDIISAKKTSNPVIEDAVFNWSQNLPLKDGTRISTTDVKLNEFSSELAKTLNNEDLSNFDERNSSVREDTITFLRKISLAPSKQNHEAMNRLTNDLINEIKETARRSDASFEARTITKKAADILYDNVESWCENFPIPCGDTLEDEEKVKTMKQNLATKLINKIGELNMNPELFNDDFLYEDLLQDELDELLRPIPKDDEFESEIPELKKDLIEKVIEANHKTREENAGHVYKQQLKDTITKTLPIESDLTADDDASFELLKENVADAFINLHCLGNNEDLKQKYKSKINDEVDNFCNDYLKRNPNSPMDNKKLNKDLYKALRNVPLPNDESMRSEVGQARIKDIINEWMQDVPLKEQTGPEQLRANKMVSVLAKKLYNIEHEKVNNPDLNTTDKMQAEIEKWMNKLPLRSQGRLEQLASDLVDMIKRSEDTRRFSASTKISLDSIDEVDQICCRRTILEKQQRSFHGNRCNRRMLSVAQVPSSSLTCDDKAYLQRIRDRNQTTKVKAKTCRDVAMCPLPMDASSQTEMRCLEEPDESAQNLRISASSLQDPNEEENRQSAQPCPRTSCPRSCAIDGQYDTAPQVIVKEYHWNSTPAESSQYRAPSPLCVDRLYPRPQQRHYQSRDAQSQSFPQPMATTHPFPLATRHPSSRSPCMTQAYEPQIPCRPQNALKPPCRNQNYASQPPCLGRSYTPQAPCLPQGYAPQPARMPQPPCSTRLDNPFTSTPKRTSRTRDPFMPAFRPRSLIVEDDDDSPGRSYSRPYISERQSIEIINPRSSDSKRHSGAEEYSVRFPIENQWDMPCNRPLISDEGNDRRERRVNYRSPQRIYRGRRRSPDRSCSKCCGYVCPFPSHLFFRQ